MKSLIVDAKSPSTVALSLGYSGLLPFVALAVGTWLAPVDSRAQVAFALVAYGATIASFLGAIHWGLTMSMASPFPSVSLAWGVFPSLVAWLALLMPLPQGLFTLAILLVLCLAVDWRVYSALGLNKWLKLRIQLTAVSVTCLVCAGATA